MLNTNAVFRGGAPSCAKVFAKGFTLIEVMITIAIIGILAGISLPLYNNYVTRAQVVDFLSQMESYKTKAAVEYSQTNTCTSTQSPAVVDLLPNGFRIMSVAEFNNMASPPTINLRPPNDVCIVWALISGSEAPAALNGKNLGFIMADYQRTITWRCISGVDSVDTKYLPNKCDE